MRAAQVGHVVSELIGSEEASIAHIILQRDIHAGDTIHRANGVRKEIEDRVAAKIRIGIGKIETEAIEPEHQLIQQVRLDRPAPRDCEVFRSPVGVDHVGSFGKNRQPAVGGVAKGVLMTRGPAHEQAVGRVKRVIHANGVVELLLMFRRQPIKCGNIQPVSGFVVVGRGRGGENLLHARIEAELLRIVGGSVVIYNVDPGKRVAIGVHRCIGIAERRVEAIAQVRLICTDG